MQNIVKKKGTTHICQTSSPICSTHYLSTYATQASFLQIIIAGQKHRKQLHHVPTKIAHTVLRKTFRHAAYNKKPQPTQDILPISTMCNTN